MLDHRSHGRRCEVRRHADAALTAGPVLAALTVEDLRCIERVELELGPGTHVFYGANGAGKTSLLEAIFVLGRGRSFRSRLADRLIRHGASRARVVGRTESHPLAHTIGVELRRSAEEGATLAKVDGAAVDSLAALAHAFPVQAIDPDAHKLIEESAARRRRWFDWGVFHVEPAFATHWSRYQRALRQRNAVLRAQARELEVWDPELGREGEHLGSARERVMAALHPYWQEAASELVGVELTLTYQPGWDRSVPLETALAAAAGRDRDRRMTTVGPHRADLVLKARGRPAREVLSRGQQKLAAIALYLAQLVFLKREVGLEPTVLLDDPSAELDHERIGLFVRRIRQLETPLIVTALERDQPLFGAPESVFHVEQGRVVRV